MLVVHESKRDFAEVQRLWTGEVRIYFLPFLMHGMLSGVVGIAMGSAKSSTGASTGVRARRRLLNMAKTRIEED